MKKFASSILIIILIICLSACSSNSKKAEDSLTDSFKEYLASKSTSYNSFKINNLLLHVLSVEKENSERDYRIVVTIYGNNEQFFDISLKTLKTEMNSFSELFISFAKKQELDNDYYLYVKISGVGFNLVYDYEEDRLYYKRYDRLLKMYKAFGSVSESKVAETEYGKNWLVENGFGEIKHHEYESFNQSGVGDPSVFIDKNGEFSSYFLNDYI